MSENSGYNSEEFNRSAERPFFDKLAHLGETIPIVGITPGPTVDQPEQNKPTLPVDRLTDTQMDSIFNPDIPEMPYFHASRLAGERFRYFSQDTTNKAAKMDAKAFLALQQYLEPFVNEVAISDALYEKLKDYYVLGEQAAALPPRQVLDYLVGKLEAYTDYLAGGPEPNNWPEAANNPEGLVDSRIIESLLPTAELIKLAIKLTGDKNQLTPTDAATLTERLDAWASSTAALVLGAGHEMLVTSLINLVNYDHLDDAMANIAEVMADKRQNDPAAYYHQFSYLANNLQKPAKAAFINRVPQIEAPPVSNIERQIYKNGTLHQHYAVHNHLPIKLAGGEDCVLPYSEYASRELQGYKEPTERLENIQAQTEVRFEDLSAEAKEALERARSAEEGVPLEWQQPQYYRLVPSLFLLGGRVIQQELCTLKFTTSDARQRITPAGQNVPASLVEDAVTSATWISANYMVVREREDGTSGHFTYHDAHPNLFGPGPEQANAFWIAGAPRRVVMPDDRGGEGPGSARPKWTIMPVAYYKVTTTDPPRSYHNILGED